jgi:hypothetical protein
MTDARDDIIPPAFFSGGIVNQYAVDEAIREIASVVKYLVALKAGHDEKLRGNSSVGDIGGRPLVSQEYGGRNPARVGQGLHGEIGPARRVFESGTRTPPGYPLIC